MLRLAPLCCVSSILLISGVHAVVLFNDGQVHSVKTPLDDAIALRSSSALTLPPGGYAVRSPSGSECAIRLSMSSVMNAMGGDVIGADASGDHPEAGAGVIVGSASRAAFYDGTTVRGGNHLGADEDSDGDALTTVMIPAGGRGGDAVVSQYYASNVTILGGTFSAGRGSVKNGHSLHAKYEAEIHVYGGTFYGSWMACSHGSIVVNGCVSRIGTRLVGRLENGHSLDVQVFEEGGGKVKVNYPENCNRYHRPKSSATRATGYNFSLCGMVLFCLGFALVV